MGLDVVIYRNRRRFEDGIRDGVLAVDADTGEVYPIEPSSDRVDSSAFIAFEARLGNAAEVQYLRSQIVPILTGESAICSAILQSGTHSGDILGPDLFGELLHEVDLIRSDKAVSGTDEVATFCEVLSRCLDEAASEGSPIVFV